MNWEDNIRKVVPYTPGEQPQAARLVKLNTNENPYPPSKRVEQAIREYNTDNLRKYPDPVIGELTVALADYYKVNKNQVFVGVGSDDVLATAFLTCFNSGKPVLFPDITYSFYDVWADLFRIPYKTVPLKDDFSICADDYIGKECGGIIFPNPNAPTGILEDLAFVEKIVSANPDVICIVDEAYIDFGGVSALPLVDKYDNLLVVQTYSKSRSLAGARIGFAIGSEKLIKYMQDVKFSYNSYTLTNQVIHLGAETLKDEEYFKECCGKVIATRERAKKELAALGFSFGDSVANFIFATHKSKPAKEIFDKLRERNIYVRYFNKPRIDNHLRISIGTDEEMDILFEALREIIG
ncbi:MAG: histidinol-phosphate transaminase [Lachnospiraceae bacterium]|nr:histidinol-phosphate transaminase [Candidatus Merdinaster equi]